MLKKNVNYALGGHIAINDISVNFTLTALDISKLFITILRACYLTGQMYEYYI